MKRSKAIEKLWRAGELSWKLKGKQKEVYKTLKEGDKDIDVILISRRFGKSFVNCVLATETCIKIPNAIVKYACPKQKMVKTIIKPIMKVIFGDCPDDFNLNDMWKEADKKYVFPNGSEIQLAGTDNGNAESLRGGYSHLCICDESGFMDDLDYVVNSILMPTTDTTEGRLLMTSTPNYKNPNHEFHEYFVLPMEEEGRLIKYTVFDSPMVDDKRRDKIIARYHGGIDNPKFRCEYLCEIPRTTETSIVPEFIDMEDKIVIDEYKVPDHTDYYVSMDVGFKDLTVALFGYYNFKEATLYIMDEYVINGAIMTTKRLCDNIKDMESLLFYNKQSEIQHKPVLRVMDNDLKLINDLAGPEHRLTFVPTEKHNKDAAISTVREWISAERIKIHKRCIHLRYHTKNAQWATTKNGTLTGKFKHLKDSPSGDLRGGHADALDALIYLVRNIQTTRNPYPNDYGRMTGNNVFYSGKNEEPSQYQEVANQMFNKKKKDSVQEHKTSMWNMFGKKDKN
jgi:hypothetical protein